MGTIKVENSERLVRRWFNESLQALKNQPRIYFNEIVDHITSELAFTRFGTPIKLSDNDMKLLQDLFLHNKDFTM